MDEGARRCRAIGMKCTCVRDRALLELHSASKRLNPGGKSPHVTEVMENCLVMGLVLPVGRGIGTLPGTGVPSRQRRKWICKYSAAELLCLPPLFAQPDPRKSLAFATGCCVFWRNANAFRPILGPTPSMICASPCAAAARWPMD